MGDLEAAHRRAALLGVVGGGGPVLTLDFSEFRPCGAALLLERASLGIGNGAGGVLRFDPVVHERIEKELLSHVLEEVLLPPTIEHAISHFDVAQLPATGDDLGLMAALAQARDLPQAQLPFQEAHRLVMQIVCHPTPIELGAAAYEAPLVDEPTLAFAVGEDIEALFDHAAEQLRTPAAAVKDDGHRAFPERRAHPAQQFGEGLGQGGIQLCGDQQQRIAAAIVDPVVGGGGHRQMASRYVSLGNRALPVIGTHVAIHVQEPHQLAAFGHAHPSQLRAHLLGAMMGGKTAERPPEGLDLGRPVKPEESAEGGRIALLELLGALHAQQRHQEQRQQRRA